MEGAAAVIGVDDPAAVVVMTDFFDGMGLESGQFGSILGAVYEAYNDGILTMEDTDGLDLTWGNWEAAMELVNKTIKREGIGAKLADGVKALPEALGREKDSWRRRGYSPKRARRSLLATCWRRKGGRQNRRLAKQVARPSSPEWTCSWQKTGVGPWRQRWLVSESLTC